MARVIKGSSSESQKSNKSQKVNHSGFGSQKIIQKEIFLAQQEAEEIKQNGLIQRKERQKVGYKEIDIAKENAMAEGAKESFIDLYVFLSILKSN